MMRMRWSRGTAAALACLAFALPAPAAQSAPDPGSSGANVMITLTISKSGVPNAPAPRVYRMIGQDGAVARMLMGWRTPIPTVSAAKEEPGKPAVTSFIYQNVGVDAELRIRVEGGGRIHLQGEIEISGTREGPALDAGTQKAPVIGTFQQHVEVTAQEGKKLRIAEATDPEGGILSLEIEADVLE